MKKLAIILALLTLTCSAYAQDIGGGSIGVIVSLTGVPQVSATEVTANRAWIDGYNLPTSAPANDQIMKYDIGTGLVGWESDLQGLTGTDSLDIVANRGASTDVELDLNALGAEDITGTRVSGDTITTSHLTADSYIAAPVVTGVTVSGDLVRTGSYTFPVADGPNTYMLTTDGAGTMDWIPQPTVAASGSALWYSDGGRMSGISIDTVTISSVVVDNLYTDGTLGVEGTLTGTTVSGDNVTTSILTCDTMNEYVFDQSVASGTSPVFDMANFIGKDGLDAVITHGGNTSQVITLGDFGASDVTLTTVEATTSVSGTKVIANYLHADGALGINGNTTGQTVTFTTITGDRFTDGSMTCEGGLLQAATIVATDGGTLQVNSDGDDKNIAITHDDTDSNIDCSSGEMNFSATVFDFDSNSNSNGITIRGADAGTEYANLYVNAADDFIIASNGGKAIVDGNSNTEGLRVAGTDAANEYADFYVDAADDLYVDVNGGDVVIVDRLMVGDDTAPSYDLHVDGDIYTQAVTGDIVSFATVTATDIFLDGGRIMESDLFETDRKAVLPIEWDIDVLLFAPDDINDEVEVFECNGKKYPAGITVTTASLSLPSDAAYTLPVEIWSGDPAAIDSDTGDMCTLTTGAGAAQVVLDNDRREINNMYVCSGDRVYLDIPSTDVDWVHVKLIGYVLD